MNDSPQANTVSNFVCYNNGTTAQDLSGMALTSPTPKRTITITPADFGYIVGVGCQTVAIETTGKLITNLTEYLTDPAKFETEFMKTKTLK